MSQCLEGSDHGQHRKTNCHSMMQALSNSLKKYPIDTRHRPSFCAQAGYCNCTAVPPHPEDSPGLPTKHTRHIRKQRNLHVPSLPIGFPWGITRLPAVATPSDRLLHPTESTASTRQQRRHLEATSKLPVPPGVPMLKEPGPLHPRKCAMTYFNTYNAKTAPPSQSPSCHGGDGGLRRWLSSHSRAAIKTPNPKPQTSFGNDTTEELSINEGLCGVAVHPQSHEPTFWCKVQLCDE